MTTFEQIAKQMRTQGLSEAKIRKWGSSMKACSPPIISHDSLQKREETTSPSTVGQNRRTTPTKSEIMRHWYESLPTKDYHDLNSFQKKLAQIDIGEPSCWACGYYATTDADLDNPMHPSPYTCWNDPKWLQKCHIVPHSIGGQEDASNLVLLCKRCHKEAPDNKKARHMKRFIANRSNYNNDFLNMIMDLAKEDMILASENIETFHLWSMENVGIHCGGDNRQTIINSVEDFCEDFRDGLITQEYIQELKKKYKT